eukprot:TRINITY_DN8721_c0_g1_i1.p1 TRINITY_DN8721_c0_g1~~TRINITY_DN8721_c0_g1_i1.p1  ORF type:complete len:609 (+),score=101.93 TRINITY_DN8721_c0_g1_i1:3-1829(+)
MTTMLSAGFLVDVYDKKIPNQLPRLQISKVQQLPNDRFRMIITDGQVKALSLLTSHWNHLVNDGKLGQNSIILLKEWVTSNMPSNDGTTEGAFIVVIKDLEVVQTSSRPLYIEEHLVLPKEASDKIKAQKVVQNSVQPISVPPQNTRNQPYHQPQKTVQKPIMNQTTNYQQNSRLGKIYPITALTPYNKWTIKARVSYKSELKEFERNGKINHSFNIDLIDVAGEIRCSAWGDSAVKFYPMLEVGNVYYISKATVRCTQKKFTSATSTYEMNLKSDSNVELCGDDNGVPFYRWNFIDDLSKLQNVSNDTIIDVLGLVASSSEVSTITTRRGNELEKINVTLLDHSETPVDLTLWGQTAIKWANSIVPKTIVGIKNLKVGEYKGKKQLQSTYEVRWESNPSSDRTSSVLSWSLQVGAQKIDSLSRSRFSGGSAPSMSIKEAQDSGLGSGGVSANFWCKATVTMIKHNGGTLMYQACPKEGCNKKISEESGGFYCPKCCETYPNFDYRYILGMFVADNTGSQFMTAFNDCGNILLGVPAHMVQQANETDPTLFETYFADASFQTWNMMVGVQESTYEGVTRLKYTIKALKQPDLVQENQRLIDAINNLTM